MIIAGLTDEALPLRVRRSQDAALRRQAELMERALLYVALTRSRRALQLYR